MTLNFKTQSLVDQGTSLFERKTQLDSFWQMVANNFYPQRAYFTTTPLTLGRDYASHLSSSYPLLIARDLANAVSSYLRPRGQEWFKTSVKDFDDISNDARRWLEFATAQQRSFIYDKESGFVRAAKEVDYDLSVFGQGCMSVEVDWKKRNLIHRCWHLKDVTWSENEAGNIQIVHRRWSPSLLSLYHIFGDKITPILRNKVSTEPDRKTEIRHVVMPTDVYYESFNQDNSLTKKEKIEAPFVSCVVDVENNYEIECVGSPTLKYCIPRWQTVSGSQYAYSPSVVSALPDSRLIQIMTLSLLEAGEKSANPPILAKQDAVRSDIAMIANSVSWIAESYDGSVDEAIKMMQIDRSGMQFALALQQATQMMLKDSFYLNKLDLPVTNEKMTATEVTRRIQEWIRNVTPLFDPMISEYNETLCKMQFETLKSVGAFGTRDEIPDEIDDNNIQFVFSNPLVEAEGREKAQKFLEMKAAIAEASAFDPSVVNMPDIPYALRDTLAGIGTPSKWLKNEDTVAKINEAQAQEARAQQLVQQLSAGGQAAEQIGKGAQAVQQAGLI